MKSFLVIKKLFLNTMFNTKKFIHSYSFNIIAVRFENENLWMT